MSESAPAAAIRAQFQVDAEYFAAHRADFATQYGGCWVAVYQQRVVGVAEGRAELTAQLWAAGVPPGLAYRELIASDNDVDAARGSAAWLAVPPSPPPASPAHGSVRPQPRPVRSRR